MYVQQRRQLRFQSTLPQGKWPGSMNRENYIRLFQSTLPQGKWHSSFNHATRQKNFNPHFHKGSDKLPGCLSCGCTISIHTSTREVTQDVCYIFNFTPISIHTSTREVTHIDDSLSRLFAISIHTSTREVTALDAVLRWDWKISIHTSTREVT